MRSQMTKTLLEKGDAKWEEKNLAIVEINEANLRYLVVEVLGRDGHFQALFETELMVPDRLADLHLPVLLRVSMYGHPVAGTDGPEGKKPVGNNLQTETPEQE